MIFLFGKGKGKQEEVKRVYIPVDLVQKYAAEGLAESDIVSRLQTQGFPQQHIDKALRIALTEQVRRPSEFPEHEERGVEMPETRGPTPLGGPEGVPSRHPSRMPLGYPPEKVLAPGAEGAPIFMEAPEVAETKFTERPSPIPEPYEGPGTSEITIEEIIEGIIAERWTDFEDRLSAFEKRDLQLQGQIEDVRKNMNEIQNSIREREQTLVSKISEFGDSIEGIEGRIGSIERIFKDFLPELSENIKVMSNLVEKMKEEKR